MVAAGVYGVEAMHKTAVTAKHAFVWCENLAFCRRFELACFGPG